MIPRHRPPFGTLALIATALRSLTGKADLRRIEHAYQHALNIDHAIWLPSARYGITHAIRASLPADGIVACPVFNCGAVFHAASQSNREIQFIDCAKDSFLAETTAAPCRQTAVILSEMFGQRFSADDLQQPLVNEASLRIFDMAMAIPTPADMLRMQKSDVTVISFGLGKSLYAGWGGLALTHSEDIAHTLRQQRAIDLKQTGVLTRAKWNAQLTARTLAHEPRMYKRLREIKQRRSQNPDNEHSGFSQQSHEWHRPPTSLSATKTLENLRDTLAFFAKRMQLSDEYSTQLSGISECLQLPQTAASAMSHYSIRVSGNLRESCRQQLWNNGIDVGSLFPFPLHLCEATNFPNAFRASMEVLNFPLSNQLDRADIRRISDCLKRALQTSVPLSENQRAA